MSKHQNSTQTQQNPPLKTQRQPFSIDMEQSMDASCRKLALAYNKLPVFHQEVINLLVVSATPMTRTDMVASLNRLPKHIRSTSRKPNAADLKPVLDSLAADKMVHISNSRPFCPEDLIDAVSRLLVSLNLFRPIAQAIWRDQNFLRHLQSAYLYGGAGEFRARLRTAFYLQEYAAFHSLMDLYMRNYRYYFRNGLFEKNHPALHPLLLPFMSSFDEKWTQAHLPEDLKLPLALHILDSFDAEVFFPMEEQLLFCESLLPCEMDASIKETFCTLLAECRLLEGKPKQAELVLRHAGELSSGLIAGAFAFLRGDYEKALNDYEAALEYSKKRSKSKKISFKSLAGLFFILALLKRNRPEDLQQAKNFTELAIKGGEDKKKAFFTSLNAFIIARQGDSAGKSKLFSENHTPFAEKGLDSLIFLLSFHWLNKEKAKARFPLVDLPESLLEKASPWTRAELTLLLSQYRKEAEVKKAEEFMAENGYKSLVDLIQPEAPWVQALNTLIMMGADPLMPPQTAKTSRLVWHLTVHKQASYWDLAPLEQIAGAGGNWSKGRKVSMKRLYFDHDEMPFLTAQDKKICKCIESRMFGGWGASSSHYTFSNKALLLLAGHPLVFSSESPSTRLEIVADKPALLVKEKQKGEMQLVFADKFNEDKELQLFFDSPTRIRVLEIDEEVQRIIRIVGRGISVPSMARDQLLKAVTSVSSLVTVQSEVEGIGNAAEMVEADSRPHVYLRPLGAGLKLDIRVQPFTDGGPIFRPGEGGETILSDIQGKRLGTKRNHKDERKQASEVLKACALTSETENSDSMWEWDLAEPETALEVLSALGDQKDRVIIKWPDGQTFSIKHHADFSQLSMRVRKEQDWFELSGELKLDDALVLSMEKLLDFLHGSHGRFITLENGQFLALTRSLKRQLEEIAKFSKKSGKSRRFHPLAALSLESLADEAGNFKGDKDWKAHLKRFRDAQALQPELPSTLKAELRDYQVEGFTWLVRLMNLGAGACLADDMGLGKTIQALAALLTLGVKGPCLVVAPTSVCMNWEKEALRFAPSFNPVHLGSGNRDKLLAELKPFDLLIVSYGLLQQENMAEKLGTVHFAAIVLDEAQAIKNFATKRSQAAMSLKADFRLITTGTPLENHLGELWNLFRFINPGLLGSLKSFNETFALPIERDQDHNASRQLKKLIRPFILRRTKNQVLEALPERTDVQLQVELSEGEMAFYEALRRQAIAKLEDADTPMEGKRMQILAEIMKLRRACCNPNLVAPEMDLPSAKLKIFGEIVDELLENGHKALVFSQFTGHLDLIRSHVEKKGISYQYLDGSTPQKERANRVNAFQAGKGDLFLISLRAGGVGLNLTAADYVIHMDPWWNPAVEDQASDRVHRIGQTRPVTVYSLVARGTIEEKILGLHQSKRALADSLLDGADMSGKMTAEELFALILEG